MSTFMLNFSIEITCFQFSWSRIENFTINDVTPPASEDTSPVTSCTCSDWPIQKQVSSDKQNKYCVYFIYLIVLFNAVHFIMLEKLVQNFTVD